MRAVWLPRDDTRGMVVDEASSDVNQLYRPRTAEKSKRPKI